MSPTVPALTAQSVSSGTATGGPNPICSDLSLKPRPCGCQRIAWYILVHMDGLGVLTQVI
jgi:hypothetical protein